jgi:flagellar biosynthesis protein FlhA
LEAESSESILSKIWNNKDFVLMFGGVAVLLIMILPIPTFLLDLFLAFSFSIALLVLFVSFYLKNPVDFSIFPTVLLGTTLFRLSLNVATTRMILLNGGNGNGNDFYQAGKLIGTFGGLVVGGNVVVGLVVFIILVTINFVVITKGAGRIAEVAARFTLDALPGKQMSVDAELQQGHIDERMAKQRRREISKEADFYGAMDGASKFIRGDAIAGILITIVNIVGGILIGVVMNGMPFGEAMQTYTVLTIGDGLIGQIPALIVSGAAGLVITRVPDNSEDETKSFFEEFSVQMFGSSKNLTALSIALLFFVFIPGLTFPFFVMFLGAATAAFFRWRNEQKQRTNARLRVEEAQNKRKTQDMDTDRWLEFDPLSLQVGMDLIFLANESKNKNIIKSILQIRSKFMDELGLVVPPIRIKDNHTIPSGQYRILLRGEEVASYEVYPRQILAISSDRDLPALKGIKTVEPSFGLDAFWIPESQRMRAQGVGYTIVEVNVVIATHLSQTIQKHAHILFSRHRLTEYLDKVTQFSPQLIEDLIPSMLTRQQVFRVLRNLLREGISIRDANTILETLADYAAKFKDPDTLTEFVRQSLSRHITRKYLAEDGSLRTIEFASDVEDALTRGIQMGEGGSISLSLNPEVQQRVLMGIRQAWEQCKAYEPVVLCPHYTRGPLQRLAERLMSHPPSFISAKEIESGVTPKRIASVSLKGMRLVS